MGKCDPTRFRVAVVLLLEQRSPSALGAIEDRAPWEWICGYALGAGPWPVDLDKHAATLGLPDREAQLAAYRGGLVGKASALVGWPPAATALAGRGPPAGDHGPSCNQRSAAVRHPLTAADRAVSQSLASAGFPTPQAGPVPTAVGPGHP